MVPRAEGDDDPEEALDTETTPARVTHELKDRAMDAAPVGITIADATDPELPLVYVNDAFVRITGYDRDFALGRNCRFLQGSDTREERVDELRRAIRNETQTTVELRNYRPDGTRFWNRVEIAPMWTNGEVTHFVGFQLDITARKEAEEAVRRERESLSRLVERINGLLEGVTTQLVRSTSEPELRQGVTGEVVRATPYVAAWIGEASLREESVVPETDSLALAEGVDTDTVEAADSLSEPFDSGPIFEALRSGEIQVAETASLTGDGEGSHPWVRSVAALPLTYREGTRGVLAVYSDDPDAFDRPERAVLASLGRAVATALDARESRRILTTEPEMVVELAVQNEEWWLSRLADETGATAEYLGTMQREDGSDVLTFTLEGGDVDPETALEAARTVAGIESLSVVTERSAGLIVDVVPESSSLVTTVAGLGARTQSLRADASEVLLTCTLPATADLRGFVDALTERYGRVELRAKRERTDAEETPERFVEGVRDRLTERQATALHRAFVAGYFDRPRAVDGDDLAESMGITRSTFHQHLAAAQRKLLQAFFDGES